MTTTTQLPGSSAPTIDFSHANASRLFTKHCPHLHLILVGCGGTGAQLAPHAARIARECRTRFRDIQLTFYDHDRVEQKNIRRQQFCQADVGEYKAEILAYRLNMAWGLDIKAVPTKFTQQSGGYYSHDTLTILLGCVDNAAARKAMHSALSHTSSPSSQLWWLDAGGTFAQGQILIGNTSNTEELNSSFSLPGICQHLPSPALIHPELLIPSADEQRPTRRTCADVVHEEPQSLTINAILAAHMADYLLRLLLTRDLRRFATYVDMNTGSVRSRAITEALLTPYYHSPSSSSKTRGSASPATK